MYDAEKTARKHTQCLCQQHLVLLKVKTRTLTAVYALVSTCAARQKSVPTVPKRLHLHALSLDPCANSYVSRSDMPTSMTALIGLRRDPSVLLNLNVR